ncbi:patatin family protein [Cystoisospora suis]|uniref:Patatin family protein n=1 Tax=Cystoisospora suis TaxID=483139 RepID=A0A2C6L791_9APIC|nr:patatin family protein [Cystoisospora suis]
MLGGGLGGGLGGIPGLGGLGGLGGIQGIGGIGSLPGFGAIPGLLGGAGGQDGGDLADLLNSVANQQAAGGNQISADFVQQMYKMLSKNSTMLEGLMNEFMQEPYLGVKEVPKPDVPKDVYAAHTDTDIPDDLKRNTTQPQRVSLEKIKQFLRAPENGVSPFDPSREGACHALVLSGAGTKGAFQAGAIVGLSEQYKAHNRPLRWDVISGVGFGGVQAAIGLPFMPGENDELDYGRSLWSFWRGVDFDKFMKCKNGLKDLLDIKATMNWIRRLEKASKSAAKTLELGAPHECDTSPLKATLSSYLEQIMQKASEEVKGAREVAITATKITGGERTWHLAPWLATRKCRDGGDCEAEQTAAQQAFNTTILALEATVATPGTFPAVAFTNDKGKLEALVDGSLSSFLSILPALKACQQKIRNDPKSSFSDEEVETGKGIVFDFILPTEADKPNTEGTLTDIEPEDDDLFDNAGVPVENMNILREKFPGVAIRHVIAGDDSLELAHELMDLRSIPALLEHGRVAGWKATTLEFFSSEENDTSESKSGTAGDPEDSEDETDPGEDSSEGM